MLAGATALLPSVPAAGQVSAGLAVLLFGITSGLGIAYRAKPIVAEAADARLDHSDLSAALYLQGYRETELVLA